MANQEFIVAQKIRRAPSSGATKEVTCEWWRFHVCIHTPKVIYMITVYPDDTIFIIWVFWIILGRNSKIIYKKFILVQTCSNLFLYKIYHLFFATSDVPLLDRQWWPKKCCKTHHFRFRTTNAWRDKCTFESLYLSYQKAEINLKSSVFHNILKPISF